MPADRRYITISISATHGPSVVFDTLRRYLEYRGYKVTFVQNFTDIDDKIIKRANEENTDYVTVARAVYRRILDRRQGLGRPAGHDPSQGHRDHGRDHRNCLRTWIDNGYAYAVDGDVYFRTKKFSRATESCPIMPIGGVGGRQPALVWTESKEDPMDFAAVEGRERGASLIGNPLGARAVPAGILNALPWSSKLFG